ncbi:hypothetical protein V493_07813 [Pseudogymnoascus sp. VKM F-4281 (FW-2241)]|nr:hypothetical protein V493_07813 [Pseudogymnoascus sp. VKM F-4281 (FW-2241)]
MSPPQWSKEVQNRLPNSEGVGLGIEGVGLVFPPRAVNMSPAQTPTFQFQGANEIPPAAYEEQHKVLDESDVRDLVLRGGSGRLLGPFHNDWDENGEEPWVDVVPFQGPPEASLMGWIDMQTPPAPMLPDMAVPEVHLPSFFEPIFLPPLPVYHRIPALIGTSDPAAADPEEPVRLPFVFPRPRRFYRVQHAAAIDGRGNETFPASRTRDNAILGLSAETIFPPCFERRINRANLERALDPMNKQPSSLVALYSNYGKLVRVASLVRHCEGGLG